MDDFERANLLELASIHTYAAVDYYDDGCARARRSHITFISSFTCTVIN